MRGGGGDAGNWSDADKALTLRIEEEGKGEKACHLIGNWQALSQHSPHINGRRIDMQSSCPEGQRCSEGGAR